jgi:hypothetical protein
MSFIGDVFGEIFGGITGATAQAEAGVKAGEMQAQAAREGIAEQRRQFDAMVKLMSPFVGAGTQTMAQQLALLGLSGEGAQQAVIKSIQKSPEMAALIQQGENAILQNASATGGLRGGNVQRALGEFRPQVLSSLLQKRFENLGGLTKIGQASAAGQAASGIESGTNVANLLANAAQARAGGVLAEGGRNRQAFSDVLNIAGTAVGAKSAGIF